MESEVEEVMEYQIAAHIAAHDATHIVAHNAADNPNIMHNTAELAEFPREIEPYIPYMDTALNFLYGYNDFCQ